MANMTNPVNVLFTAATGQPVDVSAATPLPVTEAAGVLSAAALGTPADAAWSGTGNGTVIAILKAIAINTATP